MNNEMNDINQMPKKNPLSFQIDLSKFEKATDEEKQQQEVMSESVSFFKDGMRKLMKNPLAVGSIIALVAIILMIIIVPRVVPYKYSEIIDWIILHFQLFYKVVKSNSAISCINNYCKIVFFLILRISFFYPEWFVIKVSDSQSQEI